MRCDRGCVGIRVRRDRECVVIEVRWDRECVGIDITILSAAFHEIVRVRELTAEDA